MPVGVQAIEIADILKPDRLATSISGLYREWNIARQGWLRQKQELRNYLFATDTHTTTNRINRWKNSTTVPKICQIRDNLFSQYMAALYPSDDAISWEASTGDGDTAKKRKAIEAFMTNKIQESDYWTTVSTIVLDWIDTGLGFGKVDFVREQIQDPETGETRLGYVGPKLVRVSPYDIVFNPAGEWATTPKIIRTISTLASLAAEIEDKPEQAFMKEVFADHMKLRGQFQEFSQSDVIKQDAYQVDGFGSFMEYLKSSYVEILDFYGDYYDTETGTLERNKLVTVIDQSRIIRNIVNPSWNGKDNIHMVGWRLRPDNLYAMGPLDNLVGMQYRIDHLENAKADAWDMIMHPVIKVRGMVEEFNYGPEERIYVGDEGDVEFMSPPAEVLATDNQIAQYQILMEEMAGAPKQAMGFRTPGEKTMYEVQSLDGAANKVFLQKAIYFEMNFLEKTMNSMFECGRRNMGRSEVVKIMDDDFGVQDFMKITKADVSGSGRIRPIGARRFARNANLIQNLTNLYNSSIGQDPAVAVHISGKRTAQLMEQLLNLERFELVKDNIRVYENMETQDLLQMATMEQQLKTGGAMPGDMTVPVAGSMGSPPANQSSALV